MIPRTPSSLLLCPSDTHILSHSCTHSFSLTHTLTHNCLLYILFPAQTLTHTHTHTRSHTHTLSHAYTHTLSHALSHSLTHICILSLRPPDLAEARCWVVSTLWKPMKRLACQETEISGQSWWGTKASSQPWVSLEGGSLSTRRDVWWHHLGWELDYNLLRDLKPHPCG